MTSKWLISNFKMQYNYFVYILTNYNKTVLYTGVTNDLQRRVYEHESCLIPTSFTSKYNCYYLVYFEHFSDIKHAIEQEKRIKGCQGMPRNA